MERQKSALIFGLFCFFSLFFAGAALADEKEAVLASTEWSGAVASIHVVKAVLEEKMGYSVDIRPMDAPAMWHATASGEVDGFIEAWLPSTHRAYYEETRDAVVNLGHNLTGTRIGLVVPAYVEIATIGEIQANAGKLDNRIIGIDPGAGIMKKTEAAIEAYGLMDLNLVEASGALMISILKDRIENRQWVVVTGWSPHWKFWRWDLTYLEDPEGVYGREEFIDTIVRKGLKEDDADLYTLLDSFSWELSDIQEVMHMNTREDADPYRNALEWIDAHPKLVKSWLPATYRQDDS
jgi:glycine betaine/proline transport system substrate-binding protein